MAITEDHEDVVFLLLDRGADVEAKNEVRTYRHMLVMKIKEGN
jgi:hypothetical protein